MFVRAASVISLFLEWSLKIAMKRSAAYADREAASTNENVPYGRLVVSQATTRTEAVAQRGPEV